MRIFSWLLRALIFFILFAFALNNLHAVTVHWFFGFEWRSQMVFVVLAAFSAGCAAGALSMLPGWLRRRQNDSPPAAERAEPTSTAPAAANNLGQAASARPSEFGADHPSRLGV